MDAFKVSDKVRITEPKHEFFDETGTISHLTVDRAFIVLDDATNTVAKLTQIILHKGN